MIWTPERLFVVTWCLSAIASIGADLASTKTLTARDVMASIMFYGLIGGGIGVGLNEYLGKPGYSVFGGVAIGGRILNRKEIKAIVFRVIGVSNNPSDDKEDKE